MKVVIIACTSIFIIGGLSAENVTIFDQQQKILKNDLQFQENFLQLLAKIQLQRNYNYILLIKPPLRYCKFDDLIKLVKVPWVILPNLEYLSDLLEKHSKEMLVLWCMDNLGISERNRRFLFVRHIMLRQTEILSKMCGNLRYLVGTLRHIMFTEASLKNKTIFSCDFWAAKLYENNLWSQESKANVFPNMFMDMNDQHLATHSNLLAPYNILYRDKTGRDQLEGYVGNVVKSYAKRRNLKISVMSTGNVSHYKELYGYVLTGLTDMPTMLIPLKFEGSAYEFSYPLEFISECFMIPLPRAKPINELFFSVMQWSVLVIVLLLSMVFAVFLSIAQYNRCRFSLTEVIFSDKSIRGLLGQSFVMPQKISNFMKFVYFLIFYTNLMVMTFYLAFLQSNFIQPPLQRKIRNLDDIRAAGLKIAVYPGDLEDWSQRIFKNYEDILFVTSDNYSEFKNLRDSMDLNYIYPVDSSTWAIYEEQQKLFQHKLFFFSHEMCVTRNLLFGIPLSPVLGYREEFNQHLIDVRDTGLLQHWFDEVFITLIRLKMMSFTDLSTPNHYDGLINWNNLYWIWLSYCGCMMVSLAIFIVELMAYLKA